MAQRSLLRSLGNLGLALLNATLILAALCLWLAWGALSSVERVSGQIDKAAQTVVPMRGEIVTLTEEVAAARAELAALRSGGTVDRAALEQRIGGVERKLDELNAAVARIGADPEALIDRAVRSAFDGLGDTVAGLLNSLRGSAPTPAN